jgi:hypothetical protein
MACARSPDARVALSARWPDACVALDAHLSDVCACAAEVYAFSHISTMDGLRVVLSLLLLPLLLLCACR